jgi:hypothetical protein
MNSGFQGEGVYRERQEQRGRQVEKNEQAFRAYNERRLDLERNVLNDGDPAPFVCECGDRGCHQAVNLTIEEFESSHHRPDLFAVRPGHVLPEFEEVVNERDRYWVVRKFTSEEMADRSVSTG